VTLEIALVLGVLVLAIMLFATEAARVDVIALAILLALAWFGLVTSKEAFSGFSSRAVISMGAVMIMGAGVDRSGLTRGLTRPVLAWAGSSPSRLVAAIMGAVGVLSAFMQNIGAAALFLPAVTRIARAGNIGVGRLLMPMGFAAILGGTVSMIGSGPLILLGDLLQQQGLEPFGLFAVTPYGLGLLVGGIALFALFGRFLLPTREARDSASAIQVELAESWSRANTVHEAIVPEGCALVGRARDEVDLIDGYDLHLIALAEGGDVRPAPWRHTRFAAGQTLALLGSEENVARAAADYGFEVRKEAQVFGELQSTDGAGFAEVLVSPRASIVGQPIREFALRRTYEVEPMVLLSGGEARSTDFSDQPLRAGDTLLVHGLWSKIAQLGASDDFTVVTEIQYDEVDERRRWPAGLCFAGAIALAIAGVPLAQALATGAFAMVLLRVLSIEQAYRAIDWRTMVLIGGLIPLGVAMEKSGAAAWLAENVVGLVAGTHPLFVMGAIAALATVFTLFMSNVAATVVLVPLVIGMAEPLGLDPRTLALLVGICASNSFLLPTHQVNALLMGPGGYRNKDYLRAGGSMTVLFAVGLVLALYAFAP
jgi:di/tricarboxylate transporter